MTGNRRNTSLALLIGAVVVAGGACSSKLDTQTGTETGTSTPATDTSNEADSNTGTSTQMIDTSAETVSGTSTFEETETSTGTLSDVGQNTNSEEDETDQSCIDNDSDGWCLGLDLDCDDSNPNVNPGQDDEYGNLVDDDCDGRTDEEAPCTPVSAFETLCDGLDDDCNGAVDDVDLGGDGICDCLRIGLMGTPGTLPSANFQAWLEERGTSVTKFHNVDAPELGLADLQNFDVVIIDRLIRLYSTEEAQLLADWVSSGAGVMSMTGYTAAEPSWARPNSLLETIGLSYKGGPLANGPITDFVNHPVTVGLTSVTFLGGWAVLETNASGTNTVVANLPAGGGAAGTVQQRDEGRVFVWGDEWIEFDSEWSTLPQIEQFWVNILAWLSPRDKCQTPVL